MNTHQRVIVSGPHDLDEECDVSNDNAFSSEADRNSQTILSKKGIAWYNIARQTYISDEFNSTDYCDSFCSVITNPPKSASRSYIRRIDSKSEENGEMQTDETIAL